MDLYLAIDERVDIIWVLPPRWWEPCTKPNGDYLGTLQARSRIQSTIHCWKWWLSMLSILLLYTSVYHIRRIPTYTSNYKNKTAKKTHESLFFNRQRKLLPLKKTNSRPFLHETVLPCQAVLSGIKLLEGEAKNFVMGNPMVFRWELWGDPPAAPKRVRVDHGASQPSWKWKAGGGGKNGGYPWGWGTLNKKIPL